MTLFFFIFLVLLPNNSYGTIPHGTEPLLDLLGLNQPLQNGGITKKERRQLGTRSDYSECPLCQTYCFSGKEMHQHIVTEHDSNFSSFIVCQQCKAYCCNIGYSQLNIHQRKCKNFKLQQPIKSGQVRKRGHTRDNYGKCPHCDKTCKGGKKLYEHITIQHKGDFTGLMVCEKCNRYCSKSESSMHYHKNNCLPTIPETPSNRTVQGEYASPEEIVGMVGMVTRLSRKKLFSDK